MRAVLDQRSLDFEHPQRSLLEDIFGLFGFLLLACLAALPGWWVEPVSHYASLHKPGWAPPMWVFAPALAFLYFTIGLAAWGVWHRHGWCGAHAMWFLQLLLHAAWLPVFFGLREPLWAFGVIVLLWLAILGTITVLGRRTPWTGWILVPYLGLVGYAAALNFTLWRMNP